MLCAEAIHWESLPLQDLKSLKGFLVYAVTWPTAPNSEMKPVARPDFTLRMNQESSSLQKKQGWRI